MNNNSLVNFFFVILFLLISSIIFFTKNFETFPFPISGPNGLKLFIVNYIFLNYVCINIFKPILIATNITSPEVINANNLVGNIFIFRKLPNCPPINTIKKSNQ